MFSIVKILFFFLIAFQLFDASVVTESQLKDLVRSDVTLFVTFSTSPSGDGNDDYKKQMDKEIETAKGYLLRDGLDRSTRFETIYVDQYPDVFSEYKLKTLPSFGIFRDGRMRTYEGQRSGYPIYNFLKALLTKNPIQAITSKVEKKMFNALKNVRVVGFFPNTKSAEYKAFAKAAKYFQEELGFGLVTTASIAKSYKIKEGEVAVVKPSEKTLNLGSFSDDSELIKNINENKKGLWIELNFANIYSLWENGAPAVCAFSRDVENDKALLSTFSSIAKEFQNEFLSFALVSAEVFPEFIRRVGLENEDLPTIGIIDSANSAEYIYPEDSKMKAGAAKRWIKQFLAGKLVAQTPPIYPGANNAVVPENFEQVINNGKADVMIQFYRDDNINCQEMAQFYDSLSNLFNPTGNLFAGVYNAEKYPLPAGIETTNFPYILYYQAGNPEPKVYTNADNIVSLLSFIMDHQTKLSETEIETINQVILQYQQAQSEASAQQFKEDQVHVEL